MMNPLVTIVSLLVGLFGRSPAPPAGIDDVVRKAAAYERAFELSVMDIVTVEHYDEKTTRGSSTLTTNVSSHVPKSGILERHVNSDIVMFQDGTLRFPVRCVRNEDGLGAEVPDYAHKEAVAALGARPDAKAFRRRFNLPTVPLMTLYPVNLNSRTVRKVGEDKIAGQQTWKVEFAPKSPAMESSVVTLWIQPTTGEIFRSLVEVHAPGMTVGTQVDGAFNLHMTVEYSLNERFGKLLPISMKENYDDPGVTIEGEASYTYMPRLLPDASQPPARTNPAAVPEGYTLAVNVPLVTLDVSVTGEKGAVTDLHAGDFIVEENGVAQSLAHFTPANIPYNILLLFDWSGSTVNKRDLIRQAASGFIDQLRQDDWVGLGRFAGSFQMDGWTTVHAQAAQLVSELGEFASSTTNLYTSIEQALTGELLSFVGRRRALVLLTDGRDNGFEITFMLQQIAALKVSTTQEALRYKRLLEIVKQERVPIYIIEVNTLNESYPVKVLNPEVSIGKFRKAVDGRFEQLVQTSGGRVVHADAYKDVVPLLHQISRELGTAYTLGYYSTSESNPGYRKITVHTKQPGMTVIQSRTGYVLQNEN